MGGWTDGEAGPNKLWLEPGETGDVPPVGGKYSFSCGSFFGHQYIYIYPVHDVTMR